MRSPDAEIPGDEQLFRSVSPTDLTDGACLLAQAIDLMATSCDRESYATADAVLQPNRPQDTRVVSVLAGDMPPPVMSGDGAAQYQWIAADNPVSGNDAHAEVRAHRDGNYPANKPSSRAVKLKLREELASRFRVILSARKP